MIANFILIVVFVHGYGPRVNYSAIGEFETIQACRNAAEMTRKAASDFELMGHVQPRFICAPKR